MKCFTVINTQYLASPLVPPVNSSSGWNQEEYEADNAAMNQRCAKIKFTKSHERKTEKFPFTAADFAHMIQLMSKRRSTFPDYKPPVDDPASDAKEPSIIESKQP